MSDAISLALLDAVHRKTEVSTHTGDSWTGYAIILRYLKEALERLPSIAAVAACTDDDIDRIFEAELEHIASMVAAVFPGGGVDELAYYLEPAIKETDVFDVSV